MHTRCRMHPKADTKHVQVKYNNFSLSLFLLKKNVFFTVFKFLSPSKEKSNICTRTINPSRLNKYGYGKGMHTLWFLHHFNNTDQDIIVDKTLDLVFSYGRMYKKSKPRVENA